MSAHEAERNLKLIRTFSTLLLGLGLLVVTAIHAAQPLTVCMSDSNPPLSYRSKGQVAGFDVSIARSIASELGRELRVVPFESELEKESMLTHEVNALLSAGVCDLVSGFPLLAGDLGTPTRERAKTPDYPGAKRQRDRPFVPLGVLVASRPYQGTALSIVQRPGLPAVRSLADLRGRKVGAVAGTLEGTLVAMYRGGYLHTSMVSMGQLEDPWDALGSGRIDAMLMPTTAVDARRLQYPASSIQLTDFQRPLGINLGFVALQANGVLLDATNRVIARSQNSGEIERWAQESGLRALPPTKPDVTTTLSLPTLLAD
jgi:ABC-type amino acid transport substrate-binding protein